MPFGGGPSTGGFGGADWGQIGGTLSDQTDLQTELDNKAGFTHSHVVSEVEGLQDDLDGKAATSHSHAISDVTNLQTSLDGKAASNHTHSIANVTGLQTALDGKEAAGAVTTHEGAADPHTGYQKESEKGQANGYASLDGTGKVPAAQLPASQGSEAFPVGSVFIAVVSTNPGTLLGYGTWSAFAAGRVLVGLDAGQTEFDTVEETGGEKTHTLTESEMPSHTHVQDPHSHVENQNSTTTGGLAGWGARDTSTNTSIATGYSTAPTTAVNQSTGGGGAHNNLQPYITVHMWKRTA